MALVITYNPGSYFSAFGDLLFTVYEATKANDPVTYPDYKYVADVYVDTTMIARLKAYPRPDNKIGVFNISNIVRSYIAATFNPTPAVFLSQSLALGEWRQIVTVKFGEEYDFTTYTNVTVDSQRDYYGHYNGRMIGDTTVLDSYTQKIASIRPLVTPIKEDSLFHFLSYFCTVDAMDFTIKTYNSSNVLLDTYSSSYTPLDALTLHIFNVSPSGINEENPGLIDADVAYYTFQVNGDRLYRFNIKCEPKYTVYTLHFLNRFGGFESRDFTKVSRKSIDIEKQEFGRLPYTINASGIPSYYNANNVYNEQRSVYSSQYKEKMVLNTDVLTDDEYTWLGDLMLSPMVYIEMDSFFIPVVITGNNYEFKKTINDKVTNLTINIEFGDQLNAQYR